MWETYQAGNLVSKQARNSRKNKKVRDHNRKPKTKKARIQEGKWDRKEATAKTRKIQKNVWKKVSMQERKQESKRNRNQESKKGSKKKISKEETKQANKTWKN